MISLLCHNCHSSFSEYSKDYYACLNECSMFGIDNGEFVWYSFMFEYFGMRYCIYSNIAGVTVYESFDKILFKSSQIIHFPIFNKTFQVIPFLTKLLNLKAFA